MKEKILDIFYNSIVPEAATGTIDCFMYYNICFSTSIEGKIIESANLTYIDPPLLQIRNNDSRKEDSFDELLVAYVKSALEYYDDSFFYEEVLNGEYSTTKNKLCKEKVLMTLLWSNAAIEDFQNPVQFLKRQIAYLKTSPLCPIESLGYSETLKGEIFTEVLKTKNLSWESPYVFSATIMNDEEIHDLPIVRFGLTDDTVYIYSIQQKKKARRSKKVNRALYKVNENFNPLENEEDLKDITPSSLIALVLFLLHCEKIGYSNFKMISYLPERWINKKIMINKLAKKTNSKVEFYKNKTEDLIRIQDNLTQKFIRNLLRLEYHYRRAISIYSYPFEQDSYLSFTSEIKDLGNNPLFLELSSMMECKNRLK